MNSKARETDLRTTEIINKVVGNKLADFEILSELGRGSFGVVFKVKSLIDCNIYVIKRLDLKHMKEKAQREAWKEAMILKKLNHPNIIKYYVSFLEDDNLYIVMEYAEGGDLYSLLKSLKKKSKLFTEEELWRFAYEIFMGLDYLHSNKIIHRDIKCLNIFLTKDKIIKIGDLGVSKIVANIDALICSRVGTPLYLSPELIKQKPYDFKVDLWAVGCTLFHLASLEPPFSGENLIVLGNNIVKTKQKPLSSNFSSNFINLVDGLLSKNPENRPSIKNMLELVPTYIKQDYERKIKNLSKKTSENDQQENLKEEKEGKKKLLKNEEKVVVNDKKIFKEMIEEDKKPEVKPPEPINKLTEDDKSENKKIVNSKNMIKIKPAETITPEIKINPSLAVEVKENLSNLLNEIKSELPPACIAPKESYRASIFKEVVSDQPASRKPSGLFIRKDIKSPIKLNATALNFKKDSEPLKPLENEIPNKVCTSTKNRLFSSKIRKSVEKKTDLRPNTASISKHIIPCSPRDQKLEEKGINEVKNIRPMTAIDKVRSDDKNIINININFFNIDLNRKYFDTKNTKNLLYINESIFKTEHEKERIVKEENKNDTVFNKFKSNRVTSAHIPSINPLFQNAVKLGNYIVNNKEELSKRSSVREGSNQVGRTLTKESIKGALHNKGSNHSATKNEFVFKNILSTIDTGNHRRKLTINDFK